MMSAGSIANSSVSGAVADVVSDLRPHDILMGRGSGPSQHWGNIRLRELIQTRKQEYTSTGRHHVKQEIARQILMEVEAHQGRFLSSVPAADAAPPPQDCDRQEYSEYKVVSQDIALEKIKQALRSHAREESSNHPTDRESPDIHDVTNESERWNDAGANTYGSTQSTALVPSVTLDYTHCLMQHWKQQQQLSHRVDLVWACMARYEQIQNEQVYLQQLLSNVYPVNPPFYAFPSLMHPHVTPNGPHRRLERPEQRLMDSTGGSTTTPRLR